MARFGLTSFGSYQSQSPTTDAQDCINWYPEKNESGSSKSDMSLYPTPGTIVFSALTDAPVRALLTINGRAFAAAGATLFELLSDGTTQNRGTIASDSKPASFASSATQFLLVSAGHTYAYDLTSNTLTNETAQMLGVPSLCAFSDGYFIVLLASSNQFQISNLLDATMWDGLDTAVISVFPDNCVSMIVAFREIWFFGLTKSVGYADTGAAGFPFEPIPSAFIEQGCASAFSPVRLDNSVFWWGADERGSMVAWRANGYTPVRVSNHAVEYAVQGYATNSDVISYSYQDQGHSFWVSYFPSANVTWVYDAATGMWHKRAFLSNGVQNAHHSQCHVFAFGKHLVGDWSSGNVYQMAIPVSSGSAWAFADDVGNPIRRVRRAPYVFTERTRIFFRNLQIDVETGLGPQPPLTDGNGNPREPQLMLRWSDDSGHTWSDELFINCGFSGQYLRRAFKTRLGSSLRGRIFEIAASDAIPWRITSAYLDASPSFAPVETLAAELRKRA